MKLGRTEETISSVAYGAMRLSLEGRPETSVAEGVIEAALDAGIKLVDTADVYCRKDEELGHNERLVARVLRRRADRDRIRVATKAGLRHSGSAWIRDGSPKHIRESCERSLRSLGVDRLFLYQLHAVDGHVLFESTIEALAGLQREGKCAHIGLSNVMVDHIERASRIVDVASVQNRLSPYYRESIGGGVVAACERRGITFLAYRPVGGHCLTAKLRGLAALRDVAARRGISPHRVALAWVRGKGRTVVPLVGATTIEHVTDSARAADLTLDDDEMRAIDEAQWLGDKRFYPL